MKTILIIIIIFFLQLNNNAQWIWQNGMPPRQNTLKVLHVDSDIVFAVGEKGLIIKSTDTGLNWCPQTTNTELTLRDISFINSETGFTIGDSGVILKTTDSGENWIKKEINIKNNLRAIYNLDINNSWICGDSGLIINTSDNGESWEIQNSGITSIISDIHFSNLNDGCALGYDGFFLYTSDGGNNWESNSHNGYKFRALDFVNDNNGYAVSSSVPLYPPPYNQSDIWKTTDKGKTWGNLYNSILETIARDIKFISDQTGFIVGYGLAAGIDYGIILKTVNGGSNWEQVITDPPHIVYFNSISFNITNDGIAVTNKGSIYKTSNLGTDWSLLFDDKFYGSFKSSDFKDINNGWIVGPSGSGIEGFSVLLKTNDGGNSWNEKLRLIDTPLYKVFFINSNEGWIGGYGGILYKSTDAGESWVSHNLDSSGTIWDIFFINENIGWVISGRTLKKTTDGGQFWLTQKEFPNNNISNLFFIDENYGWLTIGDYNLGKILRTTSGGID